MKQEKIQEFINKFEDRLQKMKDTYQLDSNSYDEAIECVDILEKLAQNSEYSKIISLEKCQEYRQDLENLNSVSNVKVHKVNNKKLWFAIGTIVVCTVGYTGIISVKNMKEKKAEEDAEAIAESYSKASNALEGTEEKIDEIAKANMEQKKELSDSLSFDVNDNEQLIERSIDFLTNATENGVGDFTQLSEIERYMDFYTYLNANFIDEEDYARLNYRTKTTESIVNNYQSIANNFAYDLLTVTPNTEVDFSKIVADKKSAEVLNDFEHQIALMNTYPVNSKEWIAQRNSITEYLNANFITFTDERKIDLASYELLARFMWSFDILTDGKGIPQDINKILNENGKINCIEIKEDGEKQKAASTQANTVIREILDSKLLGSKNYYDQDMSRISDFERRTGIDLEKEIFWGILGKNIKFSQNPEWKNPFMKVTPKAGKKTTPTVPYTPVTSPTTGQIQNIPNSEFEKYQVPVGDITAYEQAVQKEFESNANNTRFITNANGEVVVSGVEADANEYNNGYQFGYSKGVHNESLGDLSRKSSSFVAGANEGYSAGYSEYKQSQENFEQKKETHFESAHETETISDTTQEENYTGDIPSLPDTVLEDPVISDPDGKLDQIESQETDQIGTIIIEETEEIQDYTGEMQSLNESDNSNEELSARIATFENRISGLQFLKEYYTTYGSQMNEIREAEEDFQFTYRA